MFKILIPFVSCLVLLNLNSSWAVIDHDVAVSVAYALYSSDRGESLIQLLETHNVDVMTTWLDISKIPFYGKLRVQVCPPKWGCHSLVYWALVSKRGSLQALLRKFPDLALMKDIGNVEYGDFKDMQLIVRVLHDRHKQSVLELDRLQMRIDNAEEELTDGNQTSLWLNRVD